jgi:hypothetical protein
MSSRRPDVPTQEAFCCTGETGLELSNRPKRGTKRLQKTDEEMLHMSVRIYAWPIACVFKDGGGQGRPCSTVKLGSGHTAVSRFGRDSNS